VVTIARKARTPAKLACIKDVKINLVRRRNLPAYKTTPKRRVDFDPLRSEPALSNHAMG